MDVLANDARGDEKSRARTVFDSHVGRAATHDSGEYFAGQYRVSLQGLSTRRVQSLRSLLQDSISVPVLRRRRPFQHALLDIHHSQRSAGMPEISARSYGLEIIAA